MQLRRLILYSWLFTLVILLVAVLFAFSYLNRQQYQQLALEKVRDGFQVLQKDFAELEKNMRSAGLFLASDKKLIASISMVDTYQDINNYQHIIFDEEKKHVAKQLHDFAVNKDLHFVGLYSSTFDLISFYATSQDSKSSYGYQSYNSGEAVVKAKTLGGDFHKFTTEILLFKNSFEPELASTQTLHYHDTLNGLVIEIVTPVIRTDLPGQAHTIGFARTLKYLDKTFLDRFSLHSGLGVTLITDSSSIFSGPYHLAPPANIDILPEIQPTEIVQKYVHIPHEDAIFYGFRLQLENNASAIMLFGMDKKFLQQGVTLLRNVIFIAIGGFFCILLPAGILFIRRAVTSPIEEILSAMRSFDGDNWQPLKAKRRFREFSEMAVTLNNMVDTIRKSHDELRTLSTVVHQSPAAIVITDTDGNIEYINPKMEQLAGYKIDEVTGKNPRILQSGQTPLEAYENLWETISSGKVWKGEFINQAKDGSLFREYAVIAPIVAPDGTIHKYVAIKEDITTRKQAEKDSKSLEARLRQAERLESIGMMAGGVAHDLNNILSGIIGYPELLLADLPQDSKLRKPLEAIEDSGKRAATVVSDLLTVARGAASSKTECSLNALAQDYLASPECLKLKSLHSNVTCHHQLEATNSTILASEVHVKKCIMNLVTNASEAISGEGRVTVATYNKTVNQADKRYKLKVGEYVILSVQDTGSGISAEDLEHIFEPFYTRKTMGRSGTGLGLTVVWNTMEDHVGKVAIESSAQGTCFQLYFPVVAKAKKEAVSNKVTEDFVGNGEHILVVDDEPALRDLASRMLQSLGYNVDSVCSGELALKFLADNKVDLLILDMLMEPGMNGRQTYEKALKIYPEQKALIASGFSESADVEKALQLGASGFIKKPYTKNTLGQAAKDALRSH